MLILSDCPAGAHLSMEGRDDAMGLPAEHHDGPVEDRRLTGYCVAHCPVWQSTLVVPSTPLLELGNCTFTPGQSGGCTSPATKCNRIMPGAGQLIRHVSQIYIAGQEPTPRSALPCTCTLPGGIVWVRGKRGPCPQAKTRATLMRQRTKAVGGENTLVVRTSMITVHATAARPSAGFEFQFRIKLGHLTSALPRR